MDHHPLPVPPLEDPDGSTTSSRKLAASHPTSPRARTSRTSYREFTRPRAALANMFPYSVSTWGHPLSWRRSKKKTPAVSWA